MHQLAILFPDLSFLPSNVTSVSLCIWAIELLIHYLLECAHSDLPREFQEFGACIFFLFTASTSFFLALCLLPWTTCERLCVILSPVCVALSLPPRDYWISGKHGEQTMTDVRR